MLTSNSENQWGHDGHGPLPGVPWFFLSAGACDLAIAHQRSIQLCCTIPKVLPQFSGRCENAANFHSFFGLRECIMRSVVRWTICAKILQGALGELAPAAGHSALPPYRTAQSAMC
jgi:hypothetical protein